MRNQLLILCDHREYYFLPGILCSGSGQNHVAEDRDPHFAGAGDRRGLALQKLTTKEPTPDMTEVAIAAVEAVFDWKAYLQENFPEEAASEEP